MYVLGHWQAKPGKESRAVWVMHGTAFLSEMLSHFFSGRRQDWLGLTKGRSWTSTEKV